LFFNLYILMAKVEQQVTSSQEEGKIESALQFLSDVKEKGYKVEQIDLRKHMVLKLGLTSDQVDEALRINHLRMKDNEKSADKPGRQAVIRRTKARKSRIGGKLNNYGRVRNRSPRLPANIISIIKPSERAVSQDVIKEFLVVEDKYCRALECLKEYYLELSVVASKGKISLTRADVDEVFHRIPKFSNYHNKFYNTLKEEKEIIDFDFFLEYTKYLKDCSNTILKMRKYTADKKLHKLLAQMQQWSSLPNVELVDLLLVPLVRLMEWQTFLEKLLELADSRQREAYTGLSLACKKVGTVANYVGKYNDGICNANEMNKIQKFLGAQCQIFGKGRTILRQGNLMCRTQGWASRNKQFVFFLFNDILLWTSKKGVLQWSVYLHTCEIEPSDSKSSPEKKFKVLFSDKTSKTFFVECTSKKSREKWFNAISDAVEVAKKTRQMDQMGTQIKDVAWTKAKTKLDVAKEKRREKATRDVLKAPTKCDESTSGNQPESEDSHEISKPAGDSIGQDQDVKQGDDNKVDSNDGSTSSGKNMEETTDLDQPLIQSKEDKLWDLQPSSPPLGRNCSEPLTDKGSENAYTIRREWFKKNNSHEDKSFNSRYSRFHQRTKSNIVRHFGQKQRSRTDECLLRPSTIRSHEQSNIKLNSRRNSFNPLIQQENIAEDEPLLKPLVVSEVKGWTNIRRLSLLTPSRFESTRSHAPYTISLDDCKEG